jgi:urease accessory protein|tara:strand:- start:231 stop:887 length:657 start_codon:yes stop_codon:yes gene_type:complete
VTAPDPHSAALTLAQWLSPAFPIGAFSYSHGLDYLASTGVVDDADSFLEWARQILQHGAGRNDTLLLAAAYRAGSDAALAEIDALAAALAASRERGVELEDQGRAFVDTVNAVWRLDLPPLTYPVAVGATAARCDLPIDLTARMYLHALATSITSAAMRLAPIGQIAGQSCILVLRSICDDVCAQALASDLDALGSSVFLGDIASMAHETQYSRMFRT